MSRIFDPHKTFRLSRSKIELFVNCARCFYLDAKLGIKRPSMPAFSLNNAVDALLKKEFDIYRKSKSPHPLMKAYKIDAVPFDHDKMDEWRDALRRGITYHMPGTNFQITGGIDDVWINKAGELIIADYKATSKEAEVTLDSKWQKSYKRQVEIYQWLFRRNGFKVNPTAYFVYANGNAGEDAFNHCLRFKLTILPYEGNEEWIEPVIIDAHKLLLSENIPDRNENCEHCNFAYKSTSTKRQQTLL